MTAPSGGESTILGGDVAEQRQAQYDALRHMAPRWHPDNPERAAERKEQLEQLYGRSIEDTAVKWTIDHLVEKHADELERYGVSKPVAVPPVAVPAGPCWAAPSARPLGSNTVPVRCDLLAGPAGAHQCDRGPLGGTWTWPDDDSESQEALACITAVETIAAALAPQLQRVGAKLVLLPACTGCGCTDDEACDPPCYWTSPTTCSTCSPEQPR